MKTHEFRNMTSAEVYDETQTSDEIGDGDILIVCDEQLVGILVDAWPVKVKGSRGSFHELTTTWADFEDGKYLKAATAAMAL